MTDIAVIGAGAFGSALAMALASTGDRITLWGRNPDAMSEMSETRRSGPSLPDLDLPEDLIVTSRFPEADIYLVAVPSQSVRNLLDEHRGPLDGRTVISCAKGIERSTGLGPVEVIEDRLSGAEAGCLTGPSFAVDIARGLPTALVLAMREGAEPVQAVLTRKALRIYRTDDVTGAQLGGALKNVVAIAAGIAMGAGLGDSARASVIARGFAEMTRFAGARGAKPETLQGLAGLGDLVLTCTSEKSRNFAAGLAMGRGEALAEGKTIEGLATARELARQSARAEFDMPLAETVALVSEDRLTVTEAVDLLLSRPAGKE